jgi:predicted N-acetyltransferase YhbS
LGFDELVAAAHADAWQALGEIFASSGGGSANFPGLRLMASGLPDGAHNSGDVTAADADVEPARAFYAALGIPWGLRVPAWLRWSEGRRLRHQRLMGLLPADFLPSPTPAGTSIAVAGEADLEKVSRIDAEAFASEPAAAGVPWLAALLSEAAGDVVTVALASLGGEAVATAYAVAAAGAAGPSVMIGGLAVLPSHRRRGAGGALSSWLLRNAFDRGAQLAQLSPDDDRAARLYARLGFIETAGHDIYVEI